MAQTDNDKNHCMYMYMYLEASMSDRMGALLEGEPLLFSSPSYSPPPSPPPSPLLLLLPSCCPIIRYSSTEEPFGVPEVSGSDSDICGREVIVTEGSEVVSFLNKTV